MKDEAVGRGGAVAEKTPRERRAGGESTGGLERFGRESWPRLIMPIAHQGLPGGFAGTPGRPTLSTRVASSARVRSNWRRRPPTHGVASPRPPVQSGAGSDAPPTSVSGRPGRRTSGCRRSCAGRVGAVHGWPAVSLDREQMTAISSRSTETPTQHRAVHLSWLAAPH